MITHPARSAVGPPHINREDLLLRHTRILSHPQLHQLRRRLLARKRYAHEVLVTADLFVLKTPRQRGAVVRCQRENRARILQKCVTIILQRLQLRCIARRFFFPVR